MVTLAGGPGSSTELPADTINPQHYKGAGGLEVIDVIEAFGLQRDYYLATALKYILRAGKKDSSPAHEDVKKAIWFLEKRLAKWITPTGTATFEDLRRLYGAPLPETGQTAVS